MSVTYGFYNSVDGDRRYSALDFSRLFNGLIEDGVYMSIGDHLAVTATTGMLLNVGIGRAWFNGTWTNNDALLPLTVDASEHLLNRIDMVVLEVDTREDQRINTIKIINGTPSSVSPQEPTLSSGDGLYQYPLAAVSVKSDVTELTQADITNYVGTSRCPFVTGVIQSMNIDSLIAKWESEWNNFKATTEADEQEFIRAREEELTSWIESVKASVDADILAKDSAFDTWFQSAKDALDGDTAGHLLNMINALRGEASVKTMSASKWSSNTYSFEDLYPYANYNLSIEISNTATTEQFEAWGNASIVGSATTNVVTAFGEVPSVDIPVIVTVIAKG